MGVGARLFRLFAVLGLYGLTVTALAFLHEEREVLTGALLALIVVTACAWRHALCRSDWP